LRRKLLVSIDVNMSNGKSGRIGIHEGDNLEELARNFGIAFQLSEEAVCALQQSLQSQLDKYQSEKGGEEGAGLRPISELE